MAINHGVQNKADRQCKHAYKASEVTFLLCANVDILTWLPHHGPPQIYGCLVAGQWLMFVTGGLFLALFISQYVRHELYPPAMVTLGGAAISIGFGLLCRLLARRLIPES